MQVDRLTIGASKKSRYLSSEDLLEGSSFATGLGLKKGSVVWVEKRGVEPEVSKSTVSWRKGVGEDLDELTRSPTRHSGRSD